VGLVVVEATPVADIGTRLTVEGLRTLTDAIHAGGALASIQIFPGEIRDRLAPVDIPAERIDELVEQFEAASRCCAEAGFDGAEPHGAHGYLLSQFFSPARNARTDDYGGSPENRMRFGLRVAAAMRKGLGDDRLLLYRHTPARSDDYGVHESLAFARQLVDAGVDILDISPSSAESPGDLAAPFRQIGVPVIAVGELDDPARAVAVLTEQRADLVAIGRGLIADPEWPRKVQESRLEDIVQCVHCNALCHGNFSKDLPIECTQW
jgi:2,4-dienoyl-CoA reductase-like NADH-dependent reductase (Old Yellow Enzyme family)